MGADEAEVDPTIDLDDVGGVEGDDQVEAAGDVQPCRIAGGEDNFIPREIQRLCVAEQPGSCAHFIVASPAYVHGSLIVAIDEGEIRMKELAVHQRVPECVGVSKIAEKSLDRALIAQKRCRRVVFCQSRRKGVDTAMQRDRDACEEQS